MSLEVTEIQILATQMKKEILNKTIQTYELQNCASLQKLGCVNKDSTVFQNFVNSKINVINSRGNVILVGFDNGWNLALAPEYGGAILYFASKKEIPKKYHLKLDFKDNTALTVGLSGIGCIQAVHTKDLEKNYLYKRDFSEITNPLDKKEFTLEKFVEKISEKNQNVKAALVGKTAVVVGLSNSAFQDIIYRARISPKRNTSRLSKEEKTALYNAIIKLIKERLEAGGKDQFIDLYGKQGKYSPKMGPNMKDQNCPACKSKIEKISHGGGQVYLCPICQKLKDS